MNEILSNFSNNILGYQTEKVIVAEEIIGIDVKKIIRTNYTVVGFFYIAKDGVMLYDVTNRVINNVIILNDIGIEIGDELVICYSY